MCGLKVPVPKQLCSTMNRIMAVLPEPGFPVTTTPVQGGKQEERFSKISLKNHCLPVKGDVLDSGT